MLTFIVRPIHPVISVTNDFEISFSADVEFRVDDVLILTFPVEVDVLSYSSRVLQNDRCTSLFDENASVTCEETAYNTLTVWGLFTDNSKQYGVYIKDIRNPFSNG